MTRCKYALTSCSFCKLMIYQGRAAARSFNLLLNVILSLSHMDATWTAHEKQEGGTLLNITGWNCSTGGQMRGKDASARGNKEQKKISLFLPAICSSVSWSACGWKKKKEGRERIINKQVTQRSNYSQ